MLDRGDARFPEHPAGILLPAASIPLFVFFVAEAGHLTSSPAPEFGGSTGVEKCANVLPRWKNAIPPRQHETFEFPKRWAIHAIKVSIIVENSNFTTISMK